MATTLHAGKPMESDEFTRLGHPGSLQGIGRRLSTMLKRVLCAAVVAAGLGYALFNWGVVAYGPLLIHDAVVDGQTVELGVRYDGVVGARLAELGGSYERGAVLATMESCEHEAKLARAHAKAEAAGARIEAETLGLQHAQRLLNVRLAEVEATYTASVHRRSRAQTHAGWTARELERQKQALAGSAGSAREVDKAVYANELAIVMLEEAESEVAQARFARDAVEAELAALEARRSELGVLRAQHRASMHLVQQIQSDIDAATIRAPFDCRVVHWHAGPGTSVRVGNPIISVLDPNELSVVASVRYGDLEHLGLGTLVEVVVDDPALPLQGRIAFIEPYGQHDTARGLQAAQQYSADPDDRPVRLRIELLDTDERLVPGFPVTVRVQRPTTASRWGLVWKVDLW